MSKTHELKPKSAAPPKPDSFFSGPRADADHFFSASSPEASRTGLDAPEFSNVDVTVDSALAQQIGARAFTQGESIHFAPGQFDPDSHDGRKLIGHELAHVVQQREGRVRPEGTTHGMAINRSPALEAEAHQAGDAAARGEPTPRAFGSSHSAAAGAVLQGDFAVAPTVANPVFVELTAQQITHALRFNRAAFADADEIAEIRDVLGIAPAPAVVDEDFVRAVARYQAEFGLTQDGMIGAGTAGTLATELEAESATPGLDPEVSSNPAEMALAPAARRMRLRAQVRRRLGILTSQAFVGDRLDPTGIVSTRSSDDFGGRTNLQSIEYTGRGGATAQWLQFVNIQVFGFAAGSRTRVNLAGAVPIAGQPALPNSTPGAVTWDIDSLDAASPFYGAGGLNQRVGNSHTLFDEPAGPAANAFIGGFAAASGLDRATIIQTFESYLVRNNRVESRVNWTATSSYTIAAGVVTGRGPFFHTSPAVNDTTIRAVQRTALNARYPGNGIR